MLPSDVKDEIYEDSPEPKEEVVYKEDQIDDYSHEHHIEKRDADEVATMKDFINYLLRGNKTKDDVLNTNPYYVGNLSLGRWTKLARIMVIG